MKRLLNCFLAVLLVVVTLFSFAACDDEIEEQDANAVTSYKLRIDSFKERYLLGETFDDEVVVSKIGYNYGNVAIAQELLTDADYTVDGSAFDGEKEGKYTIVLTTKADNLTASYEVEVVKLQVKSVALSGEKLRFQKNEEFTANKLKVTVTYQDDTVRTLNADEYEVDSSAFNKAVAGGYSIKVKLIKEDFTTNYTAYVKDIPTKNFAQDGIKILAIGNSFTQDALNHVYGILRDYGVTDIKLVNLMKSNCTIAQAWEAAQSDSAIYNYEEYVGNVWQTEMNEKNNFVLRSASYGLAQADWDFVIIQQGSGFAGLDSAYGEDLENFVTYVGNHVAAKQTKIFWQQCWAYESGCPREEFAYYSNDTLTMYQAIMHAVSTKVETNSGIDGVIPSGTAVQNARTSPLQTLTRDGFHMSLTNGRYLVGLTWVCRLLGVTPTLATGGGVQGVSENLAYIKQAVSGALANPYQITAYQAQ